MNNDRIKGELTSEQQAAALQAIADIEAKLPFLIDLSVDERRALPKMGDKSRAFVDQGLVVATQNEGIMPRNFDIDEYRRDVEMYRRMESILLSLQKLMKRVEDTNLAAGSDAYGQTLLVYQAAKMAGKDGSLGPHLDRMGRRFAHKSPGVNQDVTPPAN